jgi:hypothetical protein
VVYIAANVRYLWGDEVVLVAGAIPAYSIGDSGQYFDKVMYVEGAATRVMATVLFT